MPANFFDAHLDLAYLALNKRDMLSPISADKNAPPHPPAAVTLPELAAADVRFALATIFTESVESSSSTAGATGRSPASAPAAIDAPEKYPANDSDAAHRVGRAQLEAYLTWQDQGAIALDLRTLFKSSPGTGEIRGGMGVAEPTPFPPRKLIDRALRARTMTKSGTGVPPVRNIGADVPSVQRGAQSAHPLHAGILIENADPIRSPDELSWWRDRGVVAIGLAWATPSRYAGGNSTNLGLTELGRALVREMDRLKVVHDASHLSDRAFYDLLDATDRPIIASHSNCRALLNSGTDVPSVHRSTTGATVGSPASAPSDVPPLQRHLSDDHIRHIVKRSGVIGLNLFSNFLEPGCAAPRRASLAACVRHINHICDIVGDRLHVGLGSDMDGGFSAQRLPQGIDSPRDLPRLLEALASTKTNTGGAGAWTDDDLFNFAAGNWVRFFAAAL